MKTIKTLSTVSYNTTDFLVEKLNDFVKREILEFWIFIEHLPEKDEQGKKHKHLLFVPKKTIETDSLFKELEEFDPKKPLTPLKCIFPRKSDFGNWYYYALHDKQYLASKMQMREFHYTDEDLKFSSEDYFIQLKHSMDHSRTNKKDIETFSYLEECAKNEKPFDDIFKQGVISIRYYRAWKDIYNDLLHKQLLIRGDGKKHIKEPV